ncbi:hypothetical protein EDB85DRAFT_90420 [Lactarius pseudohatsudake]|nr:hypothetical protein EDB85DRAFT_90420 [Lactarius pseudohatsudake]
MPGTLSHDIGIRLRLWLYLRFSQILPLKQSTRHHLPLNLVVLRVTKAIKPTPQSSKRSGSSASASPQSPQRRYSPSLRDSRNEDAMMASEPTLSSLTWLTSSTVMRDILFAVSLSGAVRWKRSRVGTTSASCMRLLTRQKLCSCLMCTT